MLDSVTKLVIGDLEEKREYKAMMKRADALPEDYRYTFKRIQKYIYATGIGIGIDGDLSIFYNLTDLFESSAAEGKQVLDVIGPDVAGFVDELARDTVGYTEKRKQKINDGILKALKKERR